MVGAVVLATPSPRVRGEGGVRGPLRWARNCGTVCRAALHLQSSESRRGPLTLGRYAPSTSPRTRGEVKRAIAFSRRASRPSFAARTKATDVSPPNKKGGGAPEGANRMSRTTRTDVATCPRFGRGARHGRSACANRPLRARSPFGAPPRRSPGCYP
jgi:hypothetical protein